MIGTAPEKAPPPLVGHNLLYNDDFSEGTRSLPWTASFSGTGAGRSFVEKGELCLEVTNKGVNRWDAHLRQQHLLLQKGHKYSVQFKMHSSQPIRDVSEDRPGRPALSRILEDAVQRRARRPRCTPGRSP